MRKISVIIPCYNVERYIVQCVESVLQQTYKPYEIICIDDGSTDNTPAILKELEQLHGIVVLSSENKGAAAARNKGLKHATGEFIQFLDGDDLLIEDKFEKQLLGFETGVDAVVSDWVLKDVELKEVIKKIDLSDIEQNSLETAIKKVISTCNPLYTINIVRQVHGYNENLKSAQDWEFHIRLLLAGACVKHIPGVYFVARKVSGSVSSNWIKVCKQAAEIIIQLTPELEGHRLMNDNIKKYMCGLFLDAAIYSNEDTEVKKFRKEILKWSGGNMNFIQNKFMKLLAFVFGIGLVITLHKIKIRLGK